VIELREQFKTTAEIQRAGLPFTAPQINSIIYRRFKDADPLHLYIIKMITDGLGGKEIGRRLNLRPSTITRIAKKYDISLWDNYLKKINKRYNPVDKKARAEDLYCYFLHGLSIKKIAEQTGYNPTSVSTWLNRFIPEYKKFSEHKRATSRYKKIMHNRKLLSKKFKSEKAFANYCATEVLGDVHHELSAKGESYMEIDLLVYGVIETLIELKVSARKVDEARAIGQAIFTRSGYPRPCRSDVWFASDLTLTDYIKKVARENDIVICNEKELAGVVGMVAAIKPTQGVNPEYEEIECFFYDCTITRQECLDVSGDFENHDACLSCVVGQRTKELLLN